MTANDEIRLLLVSLAVGGLALLVVIVLLVRTVGRALDRGRSNRRVRRRERVGARAEPEGAAQREPWEAPAAPSGVSPGTGGAAAQPLGRNVTHCYDKALYHEPMVPPELPPERSLVPTGLFLAWAVDAGLTSSLLRHFGAEGLTRHRNRDALPWDLYRTWHGSLDDDMLSDEGNAFARDYFDFSGEAAYDRDFRQVLVAGAPSPFHVAGTWRDYDLIKPRLDQRLATWRAKRERGKPA